MKETDSPSTLTAPICLTFCSESFLRRLLRANFGEAEDVANMMIEVINKEILEPINLGSGIGTSIADLVKTICDSKLLIKKPKIIFNKNKPSGDKKRVLDTKLAEKNNIMPKILLKDGIEKTIEWYLNNLDELDYKYNAFMD